MAIEIERKFLVRDTGCVAGVPGTLLQQGYIITGPPVSVRVRWAGSTAYLTVKKDRHGHVRSEFEYEIPVRDAREMLDTLCEGRLVEKTRYLLVAAGGRWDVDVFHGANAGLVVAEIELEEPDQAVERPDWLGDEVTGDRRYLNSYLAQHPYGSW
jgi:adenylate cyclase